MELQLKRIRESKKIKQSEMASLLSSLMGREIKVRTYGSWERQEVTMDLEQAYYCAVVLDCTIDEIAGMPAKPRSYTDPGQRQINDQYEDMNARGRTQAVDQIDNIHSNVRNLKRKDGDDTVHGDSRRKNMSA